MSGKNIGGYFELELRQGEHYHNNCLRLNTARNCLEYLLMARQYTMLYIPYFICSVVLEPLEKLKINYRFYRIDASLDPVFDQELSSGEGLLYVNYFGMKQNTVKELSRKYKNLIIDNSQAFFAEPLAGVDTYYSARKFFGVPDGAYLYTNSVLDMDFQQDVSFDRMRHLLKGVDQGLENGYADFRHNEELLNHQPIKKISNLTEKILMSVDYDRVKNQRLGNFHDLESLLKSQNTFSWKLGQGDVPMVFPFLSEVEGLKQKCISEKIYVATYWPNVLEWCRESDWEYKLSSQCVFLPIDQRYGTNEMRKIAHIVRS